MISLVIVVLLLLSAQQNTPAPADRFPPDTAAPEPVQKAPESEDPSAQRARRMIEQMVQALGGEAYLNYQDMQQQGRTYGFYKGQPSGTGAPFWRFWRWPDKDRTELLKQRNWILIYNGDEGTEITYHGVTPVEKEPLADYLRRREFSMEWVLRRWLKEPGVAYFYDGPALANRKQVERVTILNARNQAVTFFIDSNTHLPIKKSFSWRDSRDRERQEEDEIYDNYRLIQGIMTPYSVTRSRNGEVSNQRFIHSVTYNAGLADHLFAAPPITEKPKASR